MAYKPRTVKADDDGQRLERWLKKYATGLSYGQAQKAIRKGEIRINGKRCKPSDMLSEGDEVRLPPYAYEDGKARAEKGQAHISPADQKLIQSMVLYKDENIIALNKPAGLAVQGGSGVKKHIDGLLPALRKNEDEPLPKLVHRLDKETSGVLVLGRTPEATRHLMALFKGRDVRKIYLALTMPAPSQPEGEMRGALIKAGKSEYERVIVDDEQGKSARTLFHVLDKAGKAAALVAFWPLSGRTHQIRVHAAEILECPLIGDYKYGFDGEAVEELSFKPQLALHAYALSLPKPGGGIWQFHAPVPKHFEEMAESFGLNCADITDPFGKKP